MGHQLGPGAMVFRTDVYEKYYIYYRVDYQQ